MHLSRSHFFVSRTAAPAAEFMVYPDGREGQVPRMDCPDKLVMSSRGADISPKGASVEPVWRDLFPRSSLSFLSSAAIPTIPLDVTWTISVTGHKWAVVLRASRLLFGIHWRWVLVVRGSLFMGLYLAGGGDFIPIQLMKASETESKLNAFRNLLSERCAAPTLPANEDASRGLSE